MKYPIKTANGDAGEFFFAYQIASIIQWPCRLFDIDIGIDAQVEVLKADRSSTGRFVAFQIKATSQEETYYRYVSEQQLDYWKDLDFPVFVVLVDLPTQAMFLHLVDVNKNYDSTAGGRVRINFDLEKDRFSADSAKLISEAATAVALSHVRQRLIVVQGSIEEIRDAIAAQSEYADAPALIALMKERYSFRTELAQAGAVADSLSVGQSEYETAASDLDAALQELRDFMTEWNMKSDWDDHGDITEFIQEGR